MKFYGKTDVGVSRTENQDCFGIYEILPGVTLLAICDGMGGMAGGATASRLALDTFAQSMREHILPDNPEDEPDLGSIGLRFSLNASASEANRAVLSMAEDSDGKLEGMGTTLVALLVVENTLILSLNIGDSRLYEIRNDHIEQLTKDHSYVQYLIDMGQLTEKEAETFPNRNVITRAVGTEEFVTPECFREGVSDGSFILLCSDGLTNFVPNEEIRDILTKDSKNMDQLTLNLRVKKLIDLANSNGGADNITAAVIKI